MMDLAKITALGLNDVQTGRENILIRYNGMFISSAGLSYLCGNL